MKSYEQHDTHIQDILASFGKSVLLIDQGTFDFQYFHVFMCVLLYMMLPHS